MKTRRMRSLTPAWLVLTAGAWATPSELAGELMPEKTVAVLAISDAEALLGSGIAFLSACGAPVAGETPGSALSDMFNRGDLDPAASGVDMDGEVLVFIEERGGEGRVLLGLADPAAFAAAITAPSTGHTQFVGEEQIGADTVWSFGYPTGDGSHTVSQVITVRGGVAVISDSMDALMAMLTPHTAPPLAAALTMPPGDSALFQVDLATLVEAKRAEIEQLLSMMEMMMAQPQSGVAMTGPDGAVMTMYVDMFRAALDIAEQTEILAITGTPTAEALRLNCSLVFREDADVLASLPRHIESDLPLASRLPAGAIGEIVSTFDAERSGDWMAACTALFTGAAGDDPDAQAAVEEMVEMAVAFYRGLGDETAFALYPSVDGGFMPAFAMVFRTPDSAASLDQMVAMTESTATSQVMSAMYGTAPGAVRYEDLGAQTVEGAEARHIRLSGMLAAMQQMAVSDPAMAASWAQMSALMQGMDPLDYWMVADDDILLMTTEPQPDLLGGLLRGEGEGFDVPALAAPIIDGADAVGHLSLGKMFGWIDGIVATQMAAMAQQGMTMPPSPFSGIAQALSGGEVGIWGSVTFEDRGASGSLMIPTSDIAKITAGFMAMGM